MRVPDPVEDSSTALLPQLLDAFYKELNMVANQQPNGSIDFRMKGNFSGNMCEDFGVSVIRNRMGRIARLKLDDTEISKTAPAFLRGQRP